MRACCVISIMAFVFSICDIDIHIFAHQFYFNQVGEGGPLINKTGIVCGINFFDGHRCVHPLPTSVIDLCLRNWESYGYSVLCSLLFSFSANFSCSETCYSFGFIVLVYEMFVKIWHGS